MKLIPLLLIFLGTAAHSAPLPFEVYLYGEKPGLAAPFTVDSAKALRIHLARDGFATIAIRLPEESAALVALNEVSLRNAKFAGDATTVRAAALGVQAIEKSSFRNGPPPVTEIPDLVVDNELLARPGFHIPAKRIPKRPQYLFEFHAPEGAAAGDFQAQLHFRRGSREFDIPLQLRIHKLKLPKHFQLKTSFGFAPYGALVKHFGKWVDKEIELHDAYSRIAEEHRVDLHKFYVKFPKAGAPEAGVDPLSTNDKTSFLRLWDRSRSPQITPYGFSATTTDLPVPEEEKKSPTEAFWKKYESSVISHDLLDHSFVYFVDEPEAKTFPKLREELKKIRAWAPQLSFLGTTTYRKELEGTFNVWCPNLIQWDRPGFARPAEYLDRRNNHGEHFWVYTSCSAHGCGPAVDENVTDLVTDRPAAYHRAFAWAAFDAHAEGILYYNTVEGYGAGDLAPWHDPFLFHGNGEGNLFYPCTPRLCGVDGVVVVPSLRWKSIRDGLEDVEILNAGEKAGLPVRDWAKSAYRGVRDFSKSAAEFEKVKVRILEALDGAK
ncbi:MAG: glycoside hydrolase domain-containing protein [Bdellovibrionota bacterium]